jgi:hypothetical protein
MRTTRWIAAALGAAALFVSVSADADPFYFYLSGDDTASWMLDDSQAPAYSDADSFAYFTDVTWNGTTDSYGLFFYDDAYFGGISIGADKGFLSPQLFTGPVSSPSFITGTFTNLVGFPDSTRTYSLTISNTPITAPELSTWAMMLLGFAGIGTVVSIGRRKPVQASA